MVVGEEEVVVSALGGLAGAPAAVLSRLPVLQYHEPGDQDPGAGGVVAEQVAGTQFQLLQVLPLAGLQGSFGGQSWISSRAVTFPSTVLRVKLVFLPDPHTRLKVEYNWFSSPVLEWIIVLNIS